jgi:hypothetical protein
MGVRSSISAVPLSAALALLSACGDKPAPERDSTIAVVAAPAQAAAAPIGPCPATGHWVPCQVKKRLEMTGLAPRDSAISDTVRLGPTPIVYVAGGSAIAIYLFPDSVSRRRAATSLDATRFIAPDAALTMHHEATTIQNDNLLAILYSLRDQQRERVSDALMAGAPGH